MRSRFALVAILAFCAALGAGRLLFAPAPATPLAALPAAQPAEAVAAPPVVQVASPAQSAYAPGATAATPAPRKGLDRSFVDVGGGVKNDNGRMTHFLARDYSEGILHTAPAYFGASVRWVPLQQELRRGTSVTNVVSKLQSARGTLQKLPGQDRMFYPATYPQTDERMYVRKDGGLEHDIVLQRLPGNVDDSYGLAYTGRLELSKDLTLWDGSKRISGQYATKNNVFFKNSRGNTVFVLRSPLAYDASVTQSDGTLNAGRQAQPEFSRAATPCEYHFDVDESGVKLAIVTPGKWLSDPMRAYPVTIDPNLGAFGLADGSPPIYTGTAGTDTLIPANAGGVKIPMTVTCAGKPDNGYGIVPMPFDFSWYGVTYLARSNLYVHQDGFADFGPAASPCGDTPNMPIPSPGTPNNGFFPYWSDLRDSTVNGSGVYWIMDGSAPTRRLIIEWYKMTPISATNSTVISFNLVLYECENKAEFIIGQSGETDAGFASVGIENQTGTIGIQYDFNSATGGQLVNNNANQGLGGLGGFGLGGVGFGGFGLGGIFNPFFGGNNANNNANAANGQALTPISPGTSLVFAQSPLGTLSVTSSPRSGCIPLEVCFNATVILPPSTCVTTTTTGGGGSLAGSTTRTPTNNTAAFRFQWDFGDGSIGVTSSICHVWSTAGAYTVTLRITDENGTSQTQTFDVRVCDVPSVVINAVPQGGLAPLSVDLDAFAVSSTVNFTGAVKWQVDRLDYLTLDTVDRTNTFRYTTLGTTEGTPVQAYFDAPGKYRVTATFTGQDTVAGLPSTGVGTVFIFVMGANDVISNNLIITDSKFTIDWVGKQPSKTAPITVSTGASLPKNPENDTLTMKGLINLPGLSTSDLLGRRVTVALNNIEYIFDGVLDGLGNATFTSAEQGRKGAFTLRLPSGQFTLSAKRALNTDLGVNMANEARLLPEYFKIAIENTPDIGGALITYDYRSRSYSPGPPEKGSANGLFKFGKKTRGKVVISGSKSGRTGGTTALISGAFMVTSASLKLQGDTVIADITGKIARFGGDTLRPALNTDVVVRLGTYQETINFSTSPGWKSSGKSSTTLKFSYKRPATLGKTGIASLDWASQVGDFHIKTNPLPNDIVAGVGINQTLGTQAVILELQITPENGQIFAGQARFDVVKKSASQFVRDTKKVQK